MASAPGAEQAAFDTLAAVAALLDAKTTPEEAAGYKHWLLDIAAKTTEAGKEGGNFMGWGAVPVNDEERAALQKIAGTLGTRLPTPRRRTLLSCSTSFALGVDRAVSGLRLPPAHTAAPGSPRRPPAYLPWASRAASQGHPNAGR